VTWLTVPLRHISLITSIDKRDLSPLGSNRDKFFLTWGDLEGNPPSLCTTIEMMPYILLLRGQASLQIYIWEVSLTNCKSH